MIKNVDPDIRAPEWVPEYDKENNRINLVAEAGDNLNTLKEWANGAFSDDQLATLFSNMENGKIDLSGTFIGAFAEGFEAEESGCEFNCFSSVISGGSGDDKSTGYGASDQDQLEFFLTTEGMSAPPLNSQTLEGAQPFKSVFGYTLRDQQGDLYTDGRLDHVSTNAGKDRSGTNWVLTKNGYNATLQFQKGTTYSGQQPDKIFKKP